MKPIEILSSDIYECTDSVVLPENVISKVVASKYDYSESQTENSYSFDIYSYKKVYEETQEEAGGSTESSTSDSNDIVDISVNNNVDSVDGNTFFNQGAVEKNYAKELSYDNVTVFYNDGTELERSKELNNTTPYKAIPFSSFLVGYIDESTGKRYMKKREAVYKENPNTGVEEWTTRYEMYLASVQSLVYRIKLDTPISTGQYGVKINATMYANSMPSLAPSALVPNNFKDLSDLSIKYDISNTKFSLGNYMPPMSVERDNLIVFNKDIYSDGTGTINTDDSGNILYEIKSNVIEVNSESEVFSLIAGEDSETTLRGTIRKEVITPTNFTLDCSVPDKNPTWTAIDSIININTTSFVYHDRSGYDYIYVVMPLAIKYVTSAEDNDAGYDGGGTYHLLDFSVVSKNLELVITTTSQSSTTNDFAYIQDNTSASDYSDSDVYSLQGKFVTMGNSLIEANDTPIRILNAYKNGRKYFALTCCIGKYYYRADSANQPKSERIAIDPESTEKPLDAFGSPTSKFVLRHNLFKQPIITPWQTYKDTYKTKRYTNAKFYFENRPSGEIAYIVQYSNDGADRYISRNAGFNNGISNGNYIVAGSYCIYTYDFDNVKDKYDIKFNISDRYNHCATRTIDAQNFITSDITDDVLYTNPNDISIGTASVYNSYDKANRTINDVDILVEKAKSGSLTYSEMTDLFGSAGHFIVGVTGKKARAAIFVPIWTLRYEGSSSTNSATLRSRYYTSVNIKVYQAIEQYSLPMIFNDGDVVIPYITYGVSDTVSGSSDEPEYIEEPLQTDLEGNPVLFDVVRVKIRYDGAVWQELTLVEHTNEDSDQ